MSSILGGVRTSRDGYFHESFSSTYLIFIHTMGHLREKANNNDVFCDYDQPHMDGIMGIDG
jgi:hypothetical protein